MNPAPTSADSPRNDVDLHRTQRTFLFAREQVAAQMSGSVRAARQWSAYHDHEHPVTNAPDSPAR